MNIAVCDNIEIPIQVYQRHGPKTNATVYSNKRITIPPHANIAVPVCGPRHRQLALPHNRDLFFDPSALDDLSPHGRFFQIKPSHLVGAMLHVPPAKILQIPADGSYDTGCRWALPPVNDVTVLGPVFLVRTRQRSNDTARRLAGHHKEFVR